MASINKKGTGNEVPETYKKLNLHAVDTKTLGTAVLEDIFYTSYRHNEPEDSEINKKLRQVYARHFKKKMLPSKPASYLAIGGPGEGKTKTFIAATKKFSSIMGLEWVDTRTVDPLKFTPQKDQFLYAQNEFAGEISNAQTAGASTVRQNSDSEEVVIKAMNSQLALLKRASYAFFALDDIANASPSVMNAVMPIAEEKGVQGHSFGEHLVIGATGNDASIDGSSANKIATPFLTRFKVVAVHDTLDFFVERAMEKYHDRIGSAGVTDFLRLNPDCFRDNYGEIASQIGRKESTGPFATSRTWDKLMESMRAYESGYRQDAAIHRGDAAAMMQAVNTIIEEMGIDKLTDDDKEQLTTEIHSAAKERLTLLDKDVQRIVFNQIGNHKAGSAFHEYTIKRLEYNVLEMAEQMMRDGVLSEPNKELFTRKYTGSSAQESNNFAHHWVRALANEATYSIGGSLIGSDTDAIKRAGKHLATGLLAPVVLDNKEVIQLDAGEINRSLNWVMQGLVQGQYAPGKAYYSKTGQPVLHQESILKPLVLGINLAPTAKHVTGKVSDGHEITRAGQMVAFLTHNVEAASTVNDLEARLQGFGKLEEVRAKSEGSMEPAMTAGDAKKAAADNAPAPIKHSPAPTKAPEPATDDNDDDFGMGSYGHSL